MVIKSFELNDTQLKNLGAFLGRVDLKGSEVQLFNELVNLFFREEEPPKTPKSK